MDIPFGGLPPVHAVLCHIKKHNALSLSIMSSTTEQTSTNPGDVSLLTQESLLSIPADEYTETRSAKIEAWRTDLWSKPTALWTLPEELVLLLEGKWQPEARVVIRREMFPVQLAAKAETLYKVRTTCEVTPRARTDPAWLESFGGLKKNDRRTNFALDPSGYSTRPGKPPISIDAAFLKEQRDLHSERARQPILDALENNVETLGSVVVYVPPYNFTTVDAPTTGTDEVMSAPLMESSIVFDPRILGFSDISVVKLGSWESRLNVSSEGSQAAPVTESGRWTHEPTDAPSIFIAYFVKSEGSDESGDSDEAEAFKKPEMVPRVGSYPSSILALLAEEYRRLTQASPTALTATVDTYPPERGERATTAAISASSQSESPGTDRVISRAGRLG